MKKLVITLCALTALAGGALAGTETYSGKESKQTVAQCPVWYGDTEWNIGLSGVYAPTANDWAEDRYLGVDHAWGGALDIKYFFHRYFAVGAQGFGLALNRERLTAFGVVGNDDNNDFAGGALGTFTFRYPIPCSRFAPYVWGGVGGVWGGGENRLFFNNQGSLVHASNDDGRLMGQYGAGFEVRMTRHIGWTNDVSYNQVEGGHNDFWQVRTGINFAF